MGRVLRLLGWVIVLSLPAAAEIWLHARPTHLDLIELSGAWRAAEGSHPGAQAVGYMDRDWGVRQVPHDFAQRRYKDHDVWLRREVTLPARYQGQALWFTCGKTDTATAEIYFDGKTVGTIGNPQNGGRADFDDWTGFWLGPEATGGERHVIAIHLNAEDPSFAGFGEQRLWLGPAGPLKLYQERIDQAEELLRAGFVPVLVLMALFLLMLWPRIESEKERQTTRIALQGNLTAVLYLMAASGLGLEWMSPRDRGLLMLVAVPLLVLTYVEFSETLAGRPVNWLRWLVRGVSGALVLIASVELLIGVDRVEVADAAVTWALILVAYLVGSGAWTLLREGFGSQRPGDPTSSSNLVLIAAIMSSGLASLGDVLSDLGLVTWPRLVDAAFVDLPFVCGAIVLRNFVALYGRNRELTRSVQERNEELVTALAKAQEATRLKGEFVAKVSHELRTPLNSIVNIPQGLLEDFEPKDGRVHFTGDGEATVGYLQMLHRNGTHLLKVVSQLLDFSKLDAGRMSVRYEDVSVQMLVKEAVETVDHAFAKQRDIRILTEGDGLTIRLQADPARLSQVLLNLLSNAVKFSPDHGQVTVGARVLDGRELELSVKDQGIGIAPEHHAIIFESFRQVEASATRRFGGTGLGLAIAKQLVELHQGTIGFDSAPGQGSTFWARIPLHRPVPNQVEAA